MRDIVATVQREQDQIIRGPLAGILVVQGGPGTGKTAVALHRAAYLLYTHRFPLEQQGVLVVGPNPLFLRYIEHVLPSLGETGVELSTVGGLFGDAVATGQDSRAAARLKGDVRMARLLAKAVSDRQRPLRRPVTIPFGPTVLTLEEGDIGHRHRGQAPGRAPTTPAAARSRCCCGATCTTSTRPASARRGGPAADSAIEASDLGRELRRRPEVIEALERMWPILPPSNWCATFRGGPPHRPGRWRPALRRRSGQLRRDPGCHRRGGLDPR